MDREKIDCTVNSFKVCRTTKTGLSELAYEMGIKEYQLSRQIIDKAIKKYNRIKELRKKAAMV